MVRILFAAAFSVLMASTGNAATFLSWSTFGALGCQDVESNSTGASTECGTATLGSLTAQTFGAAGGGSVSAYASAYSRRSAEGVGTFLNSSRTFASLTDGISVTWRETGSSFNGTGSFSLDLLGSSQQDGDTSATGSALFRVNGADLFSYSSTTGLADTVSSVSFGVGGSFSIYAFIDAQARSCSIVASGTTCYAEMDLGSSLRLTGLSFFDASGADVTSQLSVTSESGFDYLTGAEGHDRGLSVVPLPATGWMLIAGLALLGRLRKYG